MSPKRWILLLIFYISYLMFGASIYYHIEHNEEKEQRADNLRERIQITEYLVKQLSHKNSSLQHEILDRISEYCGRPVTDYREDEYELPYTWTFYHSFFFAFTVCSTVGYGNISPTTTLGRMIMIAYSVIGIPINSLLFAGLADYFGRMFRAIYHRYKKYKMSSDIHYVPPQLSLITTLVIALIPGITLFLLIPSWVFSYFENWPFSLAFYYSYVTTTTIGFGDYVPTFQPHQHRKFGNWFLAYQIFIIIWFIFSLGYFLMIMTFITRGLQSKKLAKLEQQLSANIKATQHRIWNGVTKDVSYLRNIFNELYFLKFKPIYTELNDKHCMFRSISCPELTTIIYQNTELRHHRSRRDHHHRHRNFSECGNFLDFSRETGLNHIEPSSSSSFDPLENNRYSYSDTELHKIDRQKSFEMVEAFRETTQLLVRVVNALAVIKAPTTMTSTTINNDECYNDVYTWNSNLAEDGYHGLSDSQILASELNCLTNLSSNGNPRPVKRNRASSDFNLKPHLSTMMGRQGVVHQKRRTNGVLHKHNEWTWRGDNDQIQEEINIRYRQDNPSYIVNMTATESSQIEEEEAPKYRGKFTLPESLRRLFDFRKRSTTTTQQIQDLPGISTISNWTTTNLQQQQQQQQRKYSVVSVPEAIVHQFPPNLNYYSTVTANASPTYFSNGGKSSQEMMGKTTLGTRLSTISTGKGYRTLLNCKEEEGRLHPPSQPPPPLVHLHQQQQRSLRSLAALNSCRQQQQRSSMAIVESTLPNRKNRGCDVNARLRRSSDSWQIERYQQQQQQQQSEDHLDDVLEKTTLADLIRALEVAHTQANLDNNESAKTGRASIDIRQPEKSLHRLAIDSNRKGLLPDEHSKTFTANSASLLNRMYVRRPTLLDLTSLAGSGRRSSSNILNRRQQQQQQQQQQQSTANLSPEINIHSSFKFKRRFSIRPTALQIPPGKAPPPPSTPPAAEELSSTTSSSSCSQDVKGLEQQRQILTNSVSPTILTPAITQQQQQQLSHPLQRYFTPRPSPLAQQSSTSVGEERKTEVSIGNIGAVTSGYTTIATTITSSPSPSSSSTYSPLTRLVQITQAQKQSGKMTTDMETNTIITNIPR